MNRAALREYFYEQATLRGRFGTRDCVTFVTSAMLIGWGRDHLGEMQYHDRRSAVDRLRAAGGLKAACCHAWGDARPIDELAPGDVIYFDKPPTLGLLMPGYVAIRSRRCIHRLQIEPQMMGWTT